MSPLRQIRQDDYTAVLARDMTAMRNFYENVLDFEVGRTLGAEWIEYPLGGTLLALTRKVLCSRMTKCHRVLYPCNWRSE